MNRREKTVRYLDKILEATSDRTIRGFYRRWVYFKLDQLSDEEFEEKIKYDFPDTF